MYRARRPFNPRRLYRLIHDKFVIMEGQIQDEDGDGDSDDEEAHSQDDMDVDATDHSPGSDANPLTPMSNAGDSDDDLDTEIDEKEGEQDDFSISIKPEASSYSLFTHSLT